MTWRAHPWASVVDQLNLPVCLNVSRRLGALESRRAERSEQAKQGWRTRAGRPLRKEIREGSLAISVDGRRSSS